MQGISSQLEGGQELTRLQQKDFDNGSLLSRIIDAVNSMAKNLGASAVGKFPPPPPIDSIQVQGIVGPQANSTFTCPSELLHWTMTHNQELHKGVLYFSEISTSPNFTAPHVIHHGTSRSGFLNLATFLNDGKTKQTYYLRSYPQYPGSDPQKHTVFGGQASPYKIQMTGTSATTLLSSTGSGTASPTGMQGGQGLGKVLTRPSPGPKRNLA